MNLGRFVAINVISCAKVSKCNLVDIMGRGWDSYYSLGPVSTFIFHSKGSKSAFPQSHPPPKTLRFIKKLILMMFFCGEGCLFILSNLQDIYWPSNLPINTFILCNLVSQLIMKDRLKTNNWLPLITLGLGDIGTLRYTRYCNEQDY